MKSSYKVCYTSVITGPASTHFQTKKEADLFIKNVYNDSKDRDSLFLEKIRVLHGAYSTGFEDVTGWFAEKFNNYK